MQPTTSALLAERDFDPAQKRDDHGRWSRIGAILKHIADAAGSDVKLHEPFGHDDNNHTGLIALHHNGSLSISGHDGKSAPSHAVTVPGDQIDSLHEALGEATDHHDGYGDPGETSGPGWQLKWNNEGATLHGQDAQGNPTTTPLSREEAANLHSSLWTVKDRARDHDDLTAVAPLRGDETLDSKKKFGSAEEPLGVAVVASPDGRTVRLAPIGSLNPDSDKAALKSYTGGEGQSSAILDKNSAAQFDDALTALSAEAETRRKAITKAADTADKPDGFDDDLYSKLTEQWSTGPSSSGHGHDLDGHFGKPIEIETEWGTLVAQGYSDEFGEWHVDVGVRPKGAVQGKDWSLNGYTDDGSLELVTLATKERGYTIPVASLEPKEVRALQRYVKGAFVNPENRSAETDDVARGFDPAKHPHAAAGSPNGGQFVSDSSSGSGSQKTPPPEKEVGPNWGKTNSGSGGGGQSHKKRPHVVIPKGSLGYDPASNHGTGYGMRHGDPRVHQLQKDLTRLGLTDMHGRQLKLDGKLGPLTTAAVKKAQQKLGLKPDGIVTPAFLAQLAKQPTPPRPHKPHPATGHAPSHPQRPKARRAMTLCTRAFDFEFDGDSGDGRTLEGYAAVFNSPTRIRDLQGDFDEVVLPGAFRRSIERRMPVLQFDHGKDPRIGSTPIGTIQDLSEDSRGLHVRAQLFTHPDVERVREAIAGKAIRGMSFRFGVPQGGDIWSRRAGDVDLRELRDTDVHELGPVVFPAYDQTSVSVRGILAGLSADEMRELIHELEQHFALAVDIEDLTGRSAWDADGGDLTDVEPEDGATRNSEPEPAGPARSLTPEQLRLQERALRAIGVL